MSPPEQSGPAEIYYNDDRVRAYDRNPQTNKVQDQMTRRALELLVLPEDQPCLLLDIGCGSGISGQVLEEEGHMWIGVDIAPAMLNVAVENEVKGGLILGDIGQGMPFKPGTFDGAVSISVIQWLCYENRRSHNSAKRLYTFFSSLYACLSNSARAVFQLYPENENQLNVIIAQALRAGFTGGLLVDYPNSTKAKKSYLVFSTGGQFSLPRALGTGEDNVVSQNTRRNTFKQMKGKSVKSQIEWIKNKKEQHKQKGKKVKRDSKFTGRKRPGHF